MDFAGTFQTELGGVNVVVDYNVYQDNAALAHFVYLGSDYNFSMTRWKLKAFSAFRSKFHEVYTDSTKYGTTDVDPNTGDVVSSTSNATQNKLIVYRAIKDVFLHLDCLLQRQPRSILDYAVWYRERNSSNLDTYAKYIQLVTCHCIVHSDFLAGNIRWEVLDFIPDPSKDV
jgi:hypothetical protein